MKFSLGKSKDTKVGVRPLEEETIRRWRAAAGHKESFEQPAGEEVREISLSPAAFEAIEQEAIPRVEFSEEIVMPTAVQDLSSAPSETLEALGVPSQYLPTRQSQNSAQSEPEPQIEAPKSEPLLSKPVERQEVSRQARRVVQKAKVDRVFPSLNDELESRFGEPVKEAIGAGTVIEGKLSFDSPVKIDGTLKGDVTSTSTLIVGEQGSIEAKIEVGSLVVLGYVTGDVFADDLVEIKAGGTIEGDITTRRIIIEDGGMFHGYCNKKSD